eukprot:1317631-Pleurochrysis_carterae.AAC.2
MTGVVRHNMGFKYVILLALTGGWPPAPSWPSASGVHDVARSDIGQQAAYSSNSHQYGSICAPLHRLPALSPASAGRCHGTEIGSFRK